MKITAKLNETDTDMVEMYVTVRGRKYLMCVTHVDNFSSEVKSDMVAYGLDDRFEVGLKLAVEDKD